MKRIALASLLVVLGFLLLAASQLHPAGHPGGTPMDDYFTSKAQEKTGSNNAVTAIVFDFRGYDTLGEATVLFTAVVGVTMLFTRRRGK